MQQKSNELCDDLSLSNLVVNNDELKKLSESTLKSNCSNANASVCIIFFFNFITKTSDAIRIIIFFFIFYFVLAIIRRVESKAASSIQKIDSFGRKAEQRLRRAQPEQSNS